jgi:hypothetical protein
MLTDGIVQAPVLPSPDELVASRQVVKAHGNFYQQAV